MATTTEAAYLEAVRTLVAVITDGTDPLFGRVWIAPLFDDTDIPKIPRWPAAVITPLGGSINEFNSSIYEGTFGIVIANMASRDPMGDWGTQKLLEIGHYMTRQIKFSDSSDIKLINTSDVSAEKTLAGQTIVHRQYIFSYTIELTEAP